MPAVTVGVLVMAHGGSPEWNAAVEQAVAPLRELLPTEIAFGMADRATLQAGVSALEAHGVKAIAVVPLFISGESFLHQTEYLLGLRSDPPGSFEVHSHGHAAHHATSNPASPTDPPGATPADDGSTADTVAAVPQPVRASVPIALIGGGLIDDDRIAHVLGQRARELSRKPERESVLLLAHGMGDEAANQRLLNRLEAVAGIVRRDAPYAAVHVETLREDWPAQRADSEARIRGWVAREAETGNRVIVVPVRLFGFGPYREVLAGLGFDASERGLLPHPAITEWLRDHLRELSAASGGAARPAGP